MPYNQTQTNMKRKDIMDSDGCMSIVIVGGGASGTLLAVHLLRRKLPNLRIILIEPDDLRAGAAYRTDRPEHLLNVTAGRMSAYPDDPDHFLRWVNRHTPCQPTDFVGRGLYRKYLQQVLDEALTQMPAGTWSIYRAHAKHIEPNAYGAIVTLDNGTILHADRVVLAVGNQAPRHPETATPEFVQMPQYLGNPWAGGLGKIASTEDVLLIGTGLTAVDVLLTLDRNGHRGHITALSRHGRWPLPHAEPPCASYTFSESLPDDCLGLLRVVRQGVIEAASAGLPWQAVIDALRPHTNRLWQQFSASERCRFVRHLMPLWNIVRHRIPAGSADLIEKMSSAGRLSVLAGRLQRVDQLTHAKISATVSHSNGAHTLLRPRWIINCTGPNPHLALSESSLLRQLFAEGYAQADPLRMGLHVSAEGALIDHAGEVSSVLYAVGPLRRGSLLESTAIHEIRQQVVAFCERLVSVAV
jgi:uncharacterized NAD(P)/FAD-binding protein YdhS